MFNGVVAALEAGELSSEDGTSGALDLAWQINGATEYGYYNFSPETNDMSLATLHEETNPDNLFWGTENAPLGVFGVLSRQETVGRRDFAEGRAKFIFIPA